MWGGFHFPMYPMSPEEKIAVGDVEKGICNDCIFWKGNSNSYNANCDNDDVYFTRTQYDFSCNGFKRREYNNQQSNTRG